MHLRISTILNMDILVLPFISSLNLYSVFCEVRTTNAVFSVRVQRFILTQGTTGVLSLPGHE